MNILQEEKDGKGRFYTEDGLAEIAYHRKGNDHIIIDHTEVNPILKGKGVGKDLVAAIMQWVRNENIKVFPVCPFAKAVIERNREYQDILWQG